MIRIVLALLATASAFAPAAAHAVTTVTTYAFEAEMDSGPYSLMAGTFTASYDSATSAYTLTDIAFSLGTTVFTTANAAFVYDAASTQLIGLGGTVSGTRTIAPGTDDFTVALMATDGVLTRGVAIAYSTVGYDGIAFELEWSLAPVAVPEASTWAMLIAGFGLVGGGLRRARRRQAGELVPCRVPATRRAPLLRT